MPFLLLALLCGMLPSPAASASAAPPWGPDGHTIITQVAASRLSAPTREAIAQLLGDTTLTDISSWADQIRRDRPGTVAWHYVDIPISDTSYDSVRWCAEGNCVIAALNRYLAILGDTSRPKAERSEALKFVVHFTEDLHQPLHSGERGDKGGNDVKVTLMGRQTNLHAVWDSGLLQALGRSDDQMVADLEGLLARRTDLAAMAAGTPQDWAMQAHDVSRDVVYHFLPESLELGQAYVDSARAPLILQMERAAVRLAALLERALGH